MSLNNVKSGRGTRQSTPPALSLAPYRRACLGGRMRFLVLAAAALIGSPAVADGAEAFNAHCGDCHTLTPESGMVAPSLKGVVGRKVASLPDFQYSDALKAKGGTWTEGSLDAFLANPKAFAPGTTMFGG